MQEAALFSFSSTSNNSDSNKHNLHPCCAELKKKFEEVRASLKEAISIIERKSNALQEEKLKTKLEKEAKKKEIVVRKTLESDIHELKAQIASLSQETKTPLVTNKSGDELEKVKQLLEEEKLKTKLEKEAKKKEIVVRKTLESDIHELKAQIASLSREIKTPLVTDKSGDELKKVKQLLEEEKKRAVSEKTDATNAWNLLQIEKGKVEEQRRLVQIERTRANELNASVEKAKREFGESRNQLAKRVEEEKQKANREKRQADNAKAKLEEQKKHAEMEKKRAFEEKIRADSLLKELEEEREKTKDLLKKLEDERKRNKGFRAKLAVESSQKRKGGISVEKEDLNVKLIKEKLKLKKAQLKHVNKIMKLEKSKNNIVKQELSLLKQDFVQISGRFKVLDSHLNVGGTSDFSKVILSTAEPAAPLTVTTERDVFLREGGAPHMSRQSQSRPVSGQGKRCFSFVPLSVAKAEEHRSM
ncbi:hypothetical protein LUZ62_043655 [Rhynchospora pubera]|uniref:Uncharacterized protein n=1 Tax=Rhynchospora pubera TaxID=906938 RepID=A0AAV8FG60_9POAL|nr:hypothetical protein LUZ62_043655 [Rhynchospora pubera]